MLIVWGLGCGQPPSSVDGGTVPPDAGPSGEGPILLTSSPANGATGVPATTKIVLEFSKPIARSAFTIGANPAITFGVPVFEFEDTVVTLTPSMPLSVDTQYLVQGTMQDREGNAGTFTFAFRVAALDTTSPTLVQSAPTGMDVALDAPIVLTFSERMNPSTVTVTPSPAAKLMPPVWNEEQTRVTFAPSAPWKVSTDYQVIVAGADVAGNPLGGDITWTFRTLTPTDTTPPTVVAHAPGSQSAAPLNARISIAFSEPMLAVTVEPAISIVPNVDCAFEWSPAHDAVTCTPAAPLSPSTIYDVTVGTGAQDAQANPLAVSYPFVFFTGTVQDLVLPTIAKVTPADLATGVSRDATLKITFSEPMDVATQGALMLTGPVGVEDGTLSWNSAGTVLTWNPSATLPYGATVGWSFGPGARDIAGNPLVGIAEGSFRVIQTGTMDLPAVLDGHVTSDGMVCTTCKSLIVGDDTLFTRSYRALFSFDLNALPPDTTAITTASLNLYQSACVGSPFSKLGLLRADSVDFGPTIEPFDYSAPQAGSGGSIASSCMPRWISATVTSSVAADFANRATQQMGRSQFRIRFTGSLFPDAIADQVHIASHLDSDHAPYLRVTYEYP